MREGPAWQRELWKTTAARANDQDVWWKGTDGWQSLAAVKGNRETLLLGVINNILPLWCCSSSSYQRCAVSLQELLKLFGPPWGAHRRVGLAFNAASTDSVLPWVQALCQFSCTLQGRTCSEELSCVLWWVHGTRLRMDISLGCLLLWVAEEAVCTIPLLRFAQRETEFTVRRRRREAVAGQRQIESIWG